MKVMAALLAVLLVPALVACASNKAKPKPRFPLPLQGRVSQQAVQVNNHGIQAYQSGQFEEARADFQQAVASARDSAEAHYNLGLTLFALGQGDAARDHFIEAANLAPGDKVIWDSPALRPYSSPTDNIPKKAPDQNYSNQRPTFGGGGGPRR